MRLLIRVLALALLLGTVYWWRSAGGNTGWSKDTVAVEKTEELTGIKYTEYEDRYVPGVEMLGGGVAASAVLAGLTFIRRRKPLTTTAPGEPA